MWQWFNDSMITSETHVDILRVVTSALKHLFRLPFSADSRTIETHLCWIFRLFAVFGHSAHVVHFTSIVLTIDHSTRAWNIKQLCFNRATSLRETIQSNINKFPWTKWVHFRIRTAIRKKFAEKKQMNQQIVFLSFVPDPTLKRYNFKWHLKSHTFACGHNTVHLVFSFWLKHPVQEIIGANTVWIQIENE